MPLHVFRIMFPKATKEQLVTKNKSILLKTYKKIIILQLGICSLAINHISKQKLCRVIVVLGTGQTLLGMQNMDALDVLTINYNTIDI